jgi:hypothetical protein
MGGFTDFDWSYSGPARRSSRRSPYRAQPEPIRWVGTEQLSRECATDHVLVDRVRVKLVDRAQRYMDKYGYTGVNIRWELSPPIDPTGLYLLRLEAEMFPRTDGEWPSIRQAIAEDEADRAELADAKSVVGDRLDALATAAAAWSARTPHELREALYGRLRTADPSSTDGSPVA